MTAGLSLSISGILTTRRGKGARGAGAINRARYATATINSSHYHKRNNWDPPNYVAV